MAFGLAIGGRVEIKPGPFCGATEIRIERGFTDDCGKKRDLTVAYSIPCGECHAMFRYRGRDGQNTLIKRWNRRTHMRGKARVKDQTE